MVSNNERSRKSDKSQIIIILWHNKRLALRRTCIRLNIKTAQDTEQNYVDPIHSEFVVVAVDSLMSIHDDLTVTMLWILDTECMLLKQMKTWHIVLSA